MSVDKYLIREEIEFDCGFDFNSKKLATAIDECNRKLATLPMFLWNRIALKFSGAIIGEFLGEMVASVSDSVVNPIEQGYPDVIPAIAESVTFDELRNYPCGLELKGTCGHLPNRTRIKKGEPRLTHISGVTWKAHHAEVKKMLGYIWDFYPLYNDTLSPCVTAAFYSSELEVEDWGKVSGITGRSTKVTSMVKSGKEKMANGLACIINDEQIIKKYSSILPKMEFVDKIKETHLTNEQP